MLVGIEARRFNLLNTLLCTLPAGKLLSGLSRQDVADIRNNGALQGKVHQRTWYRRYTRNAYYINWIAVAMEHKGKGVFRQLLTPELAQCDAAGMDVVLETFTASNVPIYEHFGFELVETHRSDDVELVEYCLIRRCAGERRS